jgi:two-component system sensor histidine kinase KdpD
VLVLINLLDNAAKYSPPDEPIELRAGLADGHVLFSVVDHGLGIPEIEVERIFDKFYRIRGSGRTSGTGLGLAICKGIVEAHGGTIAAKNRAGGGLEVAFSLPLDCGDSGRKS